MNTTASIVSPIFVGNIGTCNVEVFVSDGYMPSDAVPLAGGEPREAEEGEYVIYSHDPANEVRDDVIVIGHVNLQTALARCRQWIRRQGGVIHHAA